MCVFNLFGCLQKSIFHKVRDQPQLLQKVTAIPGDITLPGLGLSPATTQQLQSELHFILHTAADIRLEVDIQSALTANYHGTAAVLQLAQGCKQLRALVHTSSCFVNMNQPRSSVVDSRIYFLRLGDRVVACGELVEVGTCQGCRFDGSATTLPWHPAKHTAYEVGLYRKATANT
jgi:hypothetical protein